MFKTLLACIGGVWVVCTGVKVYSRYERGKLEKEYLEKEAALKARHPEDDA